MNSYCYANYPFVIKRIVSANNDSSTMYRAVVGNHDNEEILLIQIWKWLHMIFLAQGLMAGISHFLWKKSNQKLRSIFKGMYKVHKSPADMHLCSKCKQKVSSSNNICELRSSRYSNFRALLLLL